MAHITADALEARAGADKLLEVELDGGAEEDATALTVRFVDEDHTLGNSLRYVLMRNAGVGFCGYSVPHPSEPYMNLRLQTKRAPAAETLQQGLRDLSGISAQLKETFAEANRAFDAK